jgi:hypothetical protein
MHSPLLGDRHLGFTCDVIGHSHLCHLLTTSLGAIGSEAESEREATKRHA